MTYIPSNANSYNSTPLPPHPNGVSKNASSGSSPNAILEELQNFIAEYKSELSAWIKNPTKDNLQNLQTLATKIRNFLQQNEGAIFAAAKSLGWPAQDQGQLMGYQTFYKDSLSAINHFLEAAGAEKSPTALSVDFHGVLEAILENVTELSYLSTTAPPN